MSEKIVQLNEEIIKGQLKELVRGSVEETLNELLEKEAESLTQAARYERSEARQGYRSGHYDRSLTTTSGDVTLHVPRLKGVSFETAIIERYRRRESSVEEALIEMYLAGVSVRRVEDITEALEAEVIPFPGSGMSLGDIDRRLAELEVQFQRLLEKAADDPIAYGDQFKEILDEQTALKELRATILAESKEHAEADRRIRDAAGMLENAVPHIAEWDESAVRQLVAQVKVLSKNEISVTLKSGIEIRQSISN